MSRPNAIRPMSRRLLGAVVLVATLSVCCSVAANGTAGASRLRKPGPPTALSLGTVGYEISASWSPPVSDGGHP